AVIAEVRRHTAHDAKLFLGVTTVSDADAPLIVTLFGNYSSIPQAEPKAVPAKDQATGTVSRAVSAVPTESTRLAAAEAAPETSAEEPAPAEAGASQDPNAP